MEHSYSHRIVEALFQLRKTVDKQLQSAPVTLPLSVPDYMVLTYINGQETVSVSDIALHLGISKASASIKMAGLEHRKMIQRDCCLFDRRSQNITLTPKGKDLVAQTEGEIARHTAPLFETLTPTEQETLVTLLSSITKK